MLGWLVWKSREEISDENKLTIATSGSVMDKAVFAAADANDMVYVENPIRLFHH